MGSSSSNSSKKAQAPSIAATQKAAADAHAIEKMRTTTLPTGKDDSESGAIGEGTGGTGNSMAVGGGRQKKAFSNY